MLDIFVLCYVFRFFQNQIKISQVLEVKIINLFFQDFIMPTKFQSKTSPVLK